MSVNLPLWLRLYECDICGLPFTIGGPRYELVKDGVHFKIIVCERCSAKPLLL
jgi:hypothetical protein